MISPQSYCSYSHSNHSLSFQLLQYSHNWCFCFHSCFPLGYLDCENRKQIMSILFPKFSNGFQSHSRRKPNCIQWPQACWPLTNSHSCSLCCSRVDHVLLSLIFKTPPLPQGLCNFCSSPFSALPPNIYKPHSLAAFWSVLKYNFTQIQLYSNINASQRSISW